MEPYHSVTQVDGQECDVWNKGEDFAIISRHDKQFQIVGRLPENDLAELIHTLHIEQIKR